MAEVIQRIPTGLWDNLQEVLWRMDAAFLRDVAQITKIPYSDLRKVVPTRGINTRISTDCNEPWWTNMTCRMSVLRSGGMWVRCSSSTFEGACCFKHRGLDGKEESRLPDGVLPYDSPTLSTLPRRVPIRIEGVVYWVNEGCCGFSEAYNVDGSLVRGITIDVGKLWVVESDPCDVSEHKN